jgi:hypothetical protein
MGPAIAKQDGPPEFAHFQRGGPSPANLIKGASEGRIGPDFVVRGITEADKPVPPPYVLSFRQGENLKSPRRIKNSIY